MEDELIDQEKKVVETMYRIKKRLCQYIWGKSVSDEKVKEFDIDYEIALILAKKSKLSSNQRKNVQYVHGMLLQYKKDTTTVKEDIC